MRESLDRLKAELEQTVAESKRRLSLILNSRGRYLDEIVGDSVWSLRDLGLRNLETVDKGEGRDGRDPTYIQRQLDRVARKERTHEPSVLTKLLSRGYKGYLVARKVLGHAKDDLNLGWLRGYVNPIQLGLDLLNPGGAVYLPPGTYTYDDINDLPIVVPQHTILFGAGRESCIETALDLKTPGKNLLQIESGAEDTQIINLAARWIPTLGDPQYYSWGGLQFRPDVKSSVIAYCYSENFRGPINIKGVGNAVLFNHIYGWGDIGIHINEGGDWGGSGGLVLGNYLQPKQGNVQQESAIELDVDAEGFVVAMNKVYWNVGTTVDSFGIEMDMPVKRNLAIGNIIYGARCGINVRGGRGAVLMGNYLIENVYHGIFVEGSHHVTIIGNHCLKNGKTGIGVYQDNYGVSYHDHTLAHNKCLENGYHGIHLQKTAGGGSLDGNQCILNGYHGVYIQESDHVTVNGGLFKNNSQAAAGTYSGVVVEDSDYAVLTGGIQAYDDQDVKTQKYGLEILGTSDYWLLIGGVYTPNLTGSWSLNAGANKKPATPEDYNIT